LRRLFVSLYASRTHVIVVIGVNREEFATFALQVASMDVLGPLVTYEFVEEDRAIAVGVAMGDHCRHRRITDGVA